MARERIIDIQRRGARAGTLRCGEQVPTSGGKKRPAKRDTWLITTGSQSVAQKLAAHFGAEVQAFDSDRSDDRFAVDTGLEELPVLLQPNGDLKQRYEHYSAAGLQRNCDGAEYVDAQGEVHPCACDENTPPRQACKLATRMSFVLDGVPVVGVFLLTTGSENAARELPWAYGFLTGDGATAASALLRIEQRSAKVDGKLSRFIVPVLDWGEPSTTSLPEALGRGQDQEQLPAPRDSEHTPPPPPEGETVPEPPGSAVDEEAEVITQGDRVGLFAKAREVFGDEKVLRDTIAEVRGNDGSTSGMTQAELAEVKAQLNARAEEARGGPA